MSKASEDFPDPDGPVNTTSRSLGMESETSFRLCSRAPLIVILSMGTSLFFPGAATRNQARAAKSSGRRDIPAWWPLALAAGIRLTTWGDLHRRGGARALASRSRRRTMSAATGLATSSLGELK